MVSPDEGFIVSASGDRSLKVWDSTGGQVGLTLAGHSSSMNGCVVSPDGGFIVSTSSETLKIWDSARRGYLITLAVEGALYGFTWSGDGRLVVAVGHSGVYFWRWVENKEQLEEAIQTFTQLYESV